MSRDAARKARILFVCAGNTCRSPMAEGFARKTLNDLGNYESAGIASLPGEYASGEAIGVTHSKFGIDISSHRSRNVKDLALDDFDLIIAMDGSVAQELARRFPTARRKLISWSIDDPKYRGYGAYEKCAEEIRKQIGNLPSILRSRSRNVEP